MLQLRKGTFFIWVHENTGDYLQEKEGYIFKYGGMLFGTDFRNKKWVVTELSTGLRIDGSPIKSKNNIEEYMKERIDRIERMEKSDTVEGWRRMFRELSIKEKEHDSRNAE